MSLASGSKLGPYEIVAPMGAGGMGEVYRARDTRLGRDVAVKILPVEFSADAVRKQRFEREAKTISSLNHPHICVLHDVGSQDGISYLVMECVEGETLAKRLEKGPLPLEQVLRYGMQIADALDKAHRSGVVHRDLKPGNIMLTSSGAKLLDFGLAKPAATLATAATLTAATQDSPVTAQGTIVGTFQYMSPEQIEGKELDGRSDIFSLGAVLYEMVTGQRAFQGKSQLSVASAILEKEPTPISSIKPLTPPSFEHVIRRSVAKNPDERWQMARDLALELKWVAEGGSQAGAPVQPGGRTKNRERVAWLLAVISAAIAVAGLIACLRVTSSAPAVIVSDISPPQGTQFHFLVSGPPALSPDGSAVVFSVRDATGPVLWVRPLDGSPAHALTGTELSNGAFWSPDSRKIGFFAQRKVQAIHASGGRPAILSDVLASGGGTWSRDGTILFVGPEGIYQVPSSGGQAVLVIRRDNAKYSFFYATRFLPDGKHFLYGAGNPGSTDETYFASVDGKENRLVLQQGNGHVTYAAGFLVYCRGTTLVAQAFDAEKGRVTGTEHPIAEQIGQGALLTFFDASQNGVLVYQPAVRGATETRLAWYDRTGKQQAFIGAPAIHYDLRLSPDAGKLASTVGNPKSEIWVDDLKRGVRMRLTFDPDTDKGLPVWSPDGKRILYGTLRGSKAGLGIYEKASSGAGGEELLLPSDKPDREAWATSWSHDGRFVLFSRGDMANALEGDIWVLPLGGDRKPSLFLHTAAAVYDGQFSPDGRWVAYTSRESNRQEVYVAPFDASKYLNSGISSSTPAGKWQISSNGGQVPRWRGDGKELFYIGPGNTVMAVEVEGKGTSFEVGNSQSLFVAPVSPFAVSYDVTPDGKRFVMSVAADEGNVPLTLMTNWTAKVTK